MDKAQRLENTYFIESKEDKTTLYDQRTNRNWYQNQLVEGEWMKCFVKIQYTINKLSMCNQLNLNRRVKTDMTNCKIIVHDIL